MNGILRLVGLWYCALTVLALSGVSTVPLTSLASGVGWMWASYAVFWAAAAYQYRSPANHAAMSPASRGVWGLIVLGGISMIASNVAIGTYTGISMREAFDGLLRSESLYNRYQQHFMRQGLMEFSIAKVPGIVAALYLKLALLFVGMKVLVLQPTRRAGHWLGLAAVLIAYLLFSVARGTSFEIFEILLLAAFATVAAPLAQGTRQPLSMSKGIGLLTLAVAALWVYSYNISARYSFGARDVCATAELCRDANSVIAGLSPRLADLLFDLQGYFTFGLYYAATFIDEVMFSSIDMLIHHLLPLGYSFLTGRAEGGVCDSHIDCGVAWKPAGIMHLQYLGLFCFMVVLVALGLATRRLVTDFESGEARGALEASGLFLLVLYMISLPVGNFVFISSSNFLAVALIGLAIVQKWLGLRWISHREVPPQSHRTNTIAPALSALPTGSRSNSTMYSSPLVRSPAAHAGKSAPESEVRQKPVSMLQSRPLSRLSRRFRLQMKGLLRWIGS